MDYKHIIALCVTVLTLCARLTGGKGEDLEKCRSTYYIHEYHVHTPSAGGNNTDEGANVGNDVIARDSSGKALITRDELVREQSQWEGQMKELQARLMEEKTMRLQQLSHFVDWTRRLSRWNNLQNDTSLDGGIRLLQDVAKNLTGMMEQEQQELKRPPIVIKEPPVKLHLTTPTPARAESKAKTRYADKAERRRANAVIKDSSGKKDGDNDNSTRNSLVAEFVEDIKKEMAEMQKAVDRVQKKYTHVYKTSKRLSSNLKTLERECHKAEGRSERLQMYHRSEIRKLTWKLGNESDLWHAGMKDVNSNLVCLDDTGNLCPGGKETRPMLVPGRNKPESLVAESLPRSQNDTPMTSLDLKPSQESRDQQQKSNDTRMDLKPSHPESKDQQQKSNDTQVVTSQPSMTPEMMIDAGVKVSQWYMDQVIAQRPKDCSDIDFWVQRQEPVQTIYLLNKTLPVKVLCEEGWTIIQKNLNTGSQEPESTKTWDDYKVGFGNLHPEAEFFWIGTQYLHWLTQMNKQDYQLRIDMKRQSDYYSLYSEYAFFQVGKESGWYRLEVGDCSGTAGDILGLFSTTNLNSQPFSTPERSLEEVYGITARTWQVGWWYSNSPSQMGAYDMPDPCFTNLNHPAPWFCGEEDDAISVAEVTMKIKPS